MERLEFGKIVCGSVRRKDVRIAIDKMAKFPCIDCKRSLDTNRSIRLLYYGDASNSCYFLCGRCCDARGVRVGYKRARGAPPAENHSRSNQRVREYRRIEDFHKNSAAFDDIRRLFSEPHPRGEVAFAQSQPSTSAPGVHGHGRTGLTFRCYACEAYFMRENSLKSHFDNVHRLM